jgi:hypothetical protein
VLPLHHGTISTNTVVHLDFGLQNYNKLLN